MNIEPVMLGAADAGIVMEQDGEWWAWARHVEDEERAPRWFLGRFPSRNAARNAVIEAWERGGP